LKRNAGSKASEDSTASDTDHAAIPDDLEKGLPLDEAVRQEAVTGGTAVEPAVPATPPAEDAEHIDRLVKRE
jgi:hypothetical protein